MKSRQVLVVEDDAAIRRGIVDALQFAGFGTFEAASGDEGLRLAIGAEVDLVLLDLILPGKLGFEILPELREQRPGLPVIILTAKGEEADRVRGLRLGADDYVVKPFSVKELLARVDAVLRRTGERIVAAKTVAFAGGVADLSSSNVQFDDGDTARLSDRECQLLRYLAAHADRVVSRVELLRNVWGIDPENLETRAVDVHLARLREKLRDRDDPPTILLTVRGKGYQLAAAPEKKTEKPAKRRRVAS